MKKVFLFVFLFLCIVLPTSVVFAQSPSSQSAAISPSPMPDYQLPYPGLLPNNPLYFFKAIRDSIVVFFISDPLKRGAFYLLQSDKRIESSWYLLKQGQQEESLALSTFSKSNNYFDMAIAQLRAAKTSGEDVSDLLSKLQQAGSTHGTVAKQMASVVKNDKSSWMQEAARMENLEKVAVGISSK